MVRRCVAATAVVLMLVGAGAASAAAKGWSIQPTPNPGSQNVLYGVSCASASACAAVGNFSGGTLAERWNGTKWKVEPSPNPSGATGYLYGVACTRANACTAIGTSQSGGIFQTLAERWNGHKWKIQSTPNPAGSTNSELDGVACASASACIAVGSYQEGATYRTLAERWNGHKWKIQATPNPVGSPDSELDGVACASGSACTAVGQTENKGTYVALVERWNGHKWKSESTPNPTGAVYSQLAGVACPSESTCIATGYYVTATESRMLAERWNGHKWTVQHAAQPAAASGNGVSCASVSACTAVGSDESGTLAERWNGSKWKVQHTPNPTGGGTIVLNGVSCASKSVCTAAGVSGIAPNRVTLAERWTGG